MIITKELKQIAKLADYVFIHVDNQNGTIEFMKEKDAKGEFHPNHVAQFDNLICAIHDYSAKYSTIHSKLTIFIDTYHAETLLSLIQVLHNDTDISLDVAMAANSENITKVNMVFDTIHLNAKKNGKLIGRFLIYSHCGYDNTARDIQFK